MGVPGCEGLKVYLDTYHAVDRIVITVFAKGATADVSAVKSRVRQAVGHALQQPAVGGRPAVARRPAEQRRMLVDVFNKFAAQEGVWTSATQRAFQNLLGHVNRGCLSPPPGSERKNTSALEGFFRTVNLLQAGGKSGAVTFAGKLLRHAFEYNCRLVVRRPEIATPFERETLGCYEYGIVDLALRYAILAGMIDPSTPVFEPVVVNESFGFVSTSCVIADAD